LYKGLDKAGDEDFVTNVVAASGAFPGPFQPKTLTWPPDKDGKTDRKFVDGGVVENLGVEGLLKYLSQNQNERRPKTLIISDASGHGNPEVSQSQVDLVTLLSGTVNISFESLHKEIYALFICRPVLF